MLKLSITESKNDKKFIFKKKIKIVRNVQKQQKIVLPFLLEKLSEYIEITEINQSCIQFQYRVTSKFRID
jgi:hypothetical protein